MAKIQKAFEVEKEFDDVGVLLGALIKDIGVKSVTEMGEDTLPKLIAAVQGADQLPEEAKEDLAASIKGVLFEVEDALLSRFLKK
jgi:hypothetical protein